MGGKFAVLEYADTYSDFINNKPLLAAGNKTLLNWYAKTKLPYKSEDMNVFGTEGVRVTLPLTAADAEANARHKDDIYGRVLSSLAQTGVRAVKPVKGSKYRYDDIIPAMSGFYILPFTLPEYIRKCAKALNREQSGIEILILDGVKELTADLLCILSNEINRMTVFTDDSGYFNNISYRFLCDSGLNINVTDDRRDQSVLSADIILNASGSMDSLTNCYKTGAFFLDMVGYEKKVAEISSRREDINCADGLEFKIDGSYVDNTLLEAMCFANNEGFANYVYGDYGDADFYGTFDYIKTINPRITAFMRGGLPC